MGELDEIYPLESTTEKIATSKSFHETKEDPKETIKEKPKPKKRTVNKSEIKRTINGLLDGLKGDISRKRYTEAYNKIEQIRQSVRKL